MATGKCPYCSARVVVPDTDRPTEFRCSSCRKVFKSKSAASSSSTATPMTSRTERPLGGAPFCHACGSQANPEAIFCRRCDEFLPRPGVGKRAGLIDRGVACLLEPLLVAVPVAVGLAVLVAIFVGLDAGFGAGHDSTPKMATGAFAMIAYGVFLLKLATSALGAVCAGSSLGKRAVGLRVVSEGTGNVPDASTMIGRESIGRAVSLLFGGLGFIWAVIDRDGQAWHDKVARTVVVKATNR